LARQLRAALVAVAFAAATTAAAAAAPASADPSPRGQGTSPSVSRDPAAVRFRQSLGLPTDDSALLVAAKAGNRARALFGVPLSDAELREMRLRQRVIADDVPTIRTRVPEVAGGDALAGVWMDNRGGGRLTAAVTRRAGAVEAALRASVRHPDRLQVVTRTWSLTDLEATERRLRGLASAHGVQVAGLKIDERANRVRVFAADPAAMRTRVRAWLPGSNPVTVERAVPAVVGTTWLNSPPLRGGQKINSSEGYTCTSAFVARGGGNYFLLTAGHCGKAFVTWDQQGFDAGITNKSDVTGTDASDLIISENYRSNQVTLAYDPDLITPTDYREITSSQAASADAVGQISCITGQNFVGLHCGEILSRSLDVSVTTHDGRTLTYSNGRELDASCAPGDSGGSALYGHQARGILSVGIDYVTRSDTCGYVHIEPALTQLGLAAVVTTPGPLQPTTV
jgi:hypothetical protein